MNEQNVVAHTTEVKGSENRFQNFIRQASVGMIVLIGKEMYIDVVNEMYGELIGRHPDKLLGKNLFDIIPEAEEHFRPILESVRISGKPVHLYSHPYTVFDTKGERKSGFLNLIYQPYKNELGVVTGVIVLCHDVTAEVESRKQKEQAEEKLKLAIESADLATYELNLKTDALDVSNRFKKIFELTDDVSRESIRKMVHPDDFGVVEQANFQSAMTGHLFFELRIQPIGGKLKWIRVNGTVLVDTEKNPTTIIGIVQDITYQKDHTENLNRLVKETTEEWQTMNEELASTNEELASTNEELSEANDRLRVANRELEQFAYVASHDLQEPLRKMQVFSNLLKERFEAELDSGARRYVDKIHASAIRMSNLIKDLLDYSRLSHSKSMFKATDLNTIVSNVLNDFELSIAQKKAIFQADQLPTIEAIPIQMNQLFHNLIGNALKFIRKGVVPQIQLSCESPTDKEIEPFHKLKPGRSYVRLSIQDNGIGFSQQYAEQIFLIFQQLNEKSKFGGYGIGLSLCKQIVENHNGVIYATGIENEGATFILILPVKHY